MSYYIPRNVKGESRLLYVFSIKALIFTVIGGGIGFLFYFLFGKLMGLTIIGLFFLAFFALIGFLIGTFKMPEIQSIKFTTKTGGENIDDIILRAWKFNTKGKKIYVCTKEEK